MKVNSINTINYNFLKPSFKHSAVPYPEYEAAYYNSDSVLEAITYKISQLFSPKVTKQADEIKSQIDKIYEAKNTPKKQLLSVLA